MHIAAFASHALMSAPSMLNACSKCEVPANYNRVESCSQPLLLQGPEQGMLPLHAQCLPCLSALQPPALPFDMQPLQLRLYPVQLEELQCVPVQLAVTAHVHAATPIQALYSGSWRLSGAPELSVPACVLLVACNTLLALVKILWKWVNLYVTCTV